MQVKLETPLRKGVIKKLSKAVVGAKGLKYIIVDLTKDDLAYVKENENMVKSNLPNMKTAQFEYFVDEGELFITL